MDRYVCTFTDWFSVLTVKNLSKGLGLLILAKFAFLETHQACTYSYLFLDYLAATVQDQVVFSDRLERLEASVLEEPCHVVIMEEYLRCPFEKLTADTYWWRYRIALATYKLRLNDSVTSVAAVEERSRRLAVNQKEYDDITEINK